MSLEISTLDLVFDGLYILRIMFHNLKLMFIACNSYHLSKLQLFYLKIVDLANHSATSKIVTVDTNTNSFINLWPFSFLEIGEIWSRLFDHRPFLNGEIKYMLKEFEVSNSILLLTFDLKFSVTTYLFYHA